MRNNRRLHIRSDWCDKHVTCDMFYATGYHKDTGNFVSFGCSI